MPGQEFRTVSWGRGGGEARMDREARKMTTEVIRDGLRRDEKRQHAQDLGLPKDT